MIAQGWPHWPGPRPRHASVATVTMGRLRVAGGVRVQVTVTALFEFSSNTLLSPGPCLPGQSSSRGRAGPGPAGGASEPGPPDSDGCGLQRAVDEELRARGRLRQTASLSVLPGASGAPRRRVIVTKFRMGPSI